MQNAAAFTLSSSPLFKPSRPSCTHSRFDALQRRHSVVVFPRVRSWSSPSLSRQWNSLPHLQSASDQDYISSNNDSMQNAAEVCRSNTTNLMPEESEKTKQMKEEFDEWVLESGEEETMVNKFEEWMLTHGRLYEETIWKIKSYLVFKEGVQWVEGPYNNGESKETRMAMLMSVMDTLIPEESQQSTAAQGYKSNIGFDEWVLESGEEEAMVNKFEEWMLIHERVYKDAKEKIKRYLIFKERVQRIEAYNNGESKETGMTMGLNYYSDYTYQEFRMKILNQFEAFTR